MIAKVRRRAASSSTVPGSGAARVGGGRRMADIKDFRRGTLAPAGVPRMENVRARAAAESLTLPPGPDGVAKRCRREETGSPPDPGDPVDRNAFVELLNEDLELEFQSIVQYVQHIASVKGAEYLSTLDELAKHVEQELNHALTLARQIDFLGGVPSTRVPEITQVTDARAALQAALELESRQLDRYRERSAQAEELSLPDVAETLAPLLEQT